MSRILTLANVLTIVFSLNNARAQVANIYVNASQILHTNTTSLTGACLEDVNHEIYGGLYSQMIFGESFQEPGTSAASLAGFTAYGGEWLVTNNILVSANGSGPKQIYNGFNQSSGDVSVQLQFSSNEGGDAGLIFQVSQSGVGADNFTGYEVSLAPAGYLVLGRHVQNFQSLSQVSYSVPLGQWITLEVKYTNATINVLVNGSSVMQYTDTQQPLTSGQVGLRNYQQDVLFDNFFINTTNVPFVFTGNGLNGIVSAMWFPVSTGNAAGQCSLDTTNVFVGTQSQVLTFTSGTGVIGVANRGLNSWGMNFVGGSLYTGTLDVRADVPSIIWVSSESADGSTVYAEQSLTVISNNWQQINFSLTPSASDRLRCGWLCVSGTGHLGSVCRIAGAQGCGAGVDQPRYHRFALWWFDGQCLGVSLEKHDWTAGSTSALHGNLVSVFHGWLGHSGLSELMRSGRIFGRA
jgi:Domain of Unknown Function (DUF1080)